MTSKYEGHTPGKWGRNIPPARKYPTVYAGRNTHVACMIQGAGVTDEEMEANTNLVSDAPSILKQRDALRDALECLIGQLEDTDATTCDHEAGICNCGIRTAVNIANAALTLCNETEAGHAR